jgi:hypothetical protein
VILHYLYLMIFHDFYACLVYILGYHLVHVENLYIHFDLLARKYVLNKILSQEKLLVKIFTSKIIKSFYIYVSRYIVLYTWMILYMDLEYC